jgi:Ca-activated chloride channel family protein
MVLGFLFLFLDIFLGKKTSWVNKLNLFNENKKIMIKKYI